MTVLTEEQRAALTVLVVEDNVFMRDMIADLLRQSGVTKVYVAGDGREAVDAIATFMPDLVLTDWSMPGMSGLELLKWVRRSPNSPNPKLPVIMITGNNQRQEIILARDAGATEFISKPVTAKAILARLSSAILAPREFVRAPDFVGPCRRRRNPAQYNGKKRRLDDDLVVFNQSDEEAAAVRDFRVRVIEAIQKELEPLIALVKTADLRERIVLLNVRSRTQKISELTRQIHDSMLAEVAESLIVFINAVGTTGAADREVVFMHLSAVHTLLKTDLHHPERDAMVEGLRKVVNSRLAKAAKSA